MDNDELMLAVHELFGSLEQSRKCNPAAAFEELMEAIELVAEERGAFLEGPQM